LKILLITTALIAITAVAFFMFQESLLLVMGDYLVVQDQLRPADVIHVIAGPDYRTNYAIHLYQQGLGSTLFFTGGWCDTHQDFHGERGERLSLAEGVPAGDIASNDSPVTSTYSEALLLKEFIEKNDPAARSVIVVSDPYHMRRARWTYRLILGDQVNVQMAPVPFEQTPYKQEWWIDRKSKKYVREEYTKIVYYLLRYQLSRGNIKEWLASLDTE
jgi:uncharacterized SAM-binding protein YcdF (DUF218 family)